MKRDIVGVIASAGGFILGYLLPTLAFMLVYLVSGTPQPEGRGSVFEQTVTVFYFAGVYALVGSIAYTAITAASRNWRQRPPREAAAISVLVGVVGQILNWTGLSLFALVPLMRVFPGKVGMVLGTAMPGIIVGVAVLIWSATRTAKVPAAAGNADDKT
jgi:hypothetical protein